MELKIRKCLHFLNILFIIISTFQIFIPYFFMFNEFAFCKWIFFHPFFSEGTMTNLVSLVEVILVGDQNDSMRQQV